MKRGRSGTVLVVDDDPHLRMLMARWLEGADPGSPGCGPPAAMPIADADAAADADADAETETATETENEK